MKSYIALNIGYLVRKSKMNNDEFGRVFDLNRGTIGSYIDEKAQPKIATLQKISEYFDVTLDELISRDMEKSTKNLSQGNKNSVIQQGINISGDNTVQHNVSSKTMEEITKNYQDTIKKQQEQIDKLIEVINKLSNK